MALRSVAGMGIAAVAVVLLMAGSARGGGAVSAFTLKNADYLLVNWALGQWKPGVTPSEKLETAARWFLGLPYRLDPLGEGQGEDADPVYTWDQVDCITMPEVLLGLVYGKTVRDAEKRTLRLRYKDGIIAWDHRRHFTLAQWLPAAVELGLLRDITAEIAGKDAVQARKRWSSSLSCKGRWKDFCKRMGSHFPETTVTFTYWPLKNAIAGATKLPRGSLIFFLHTARPSVPYQVFHAGVVGMDASGRPTLIHASKKAGRVVQTDAAAYLASLPNRYKKWPVAGVLIYAPVSDGTPR